MPRLLIVSYVYPPINTIGTLRISSFVRYLPSRGWDPYVVTVRPGPWVHSEGPAPADEDPSRVCRVWGADLGRFLAKTSGGALRAGGITRARVRERGRNSLLRTALELYDNFLAFPDSTWPWRLLGLRRALSFARRVRPDAVLSSSSPFSAHLLGARLSKALGVPWVADFRNLWSGNPSIDYSSLGHAARRVLERRVLRGARAISTLTPDLAAELARLHSKPVFIVANGFEPGPDAPPKPRSGPFTLVYTGMLYPKRQDPRPLFAAVRQMGRSGSADPDRFRIAFYGPDHDITMRLAEKEGVGPFVAAHEAVSWEDSLRLQRDADLLLVLEWCDKTARGIIPGKLYEYLGAKRPILAIGPPGDAVDELLKRTGVGRVLDEPDAIRTFLEAALRDPGGVDLMPRRNEAEVRAFTRENQASILAANLDALLK